MLAAGGEGRLLDSSEKYREILKVEYDGAWAGH